MAGDGETKARNSCLQSGACRVRFRLGHLDLLGDLDHHHLHRSSPCGLGGHLLSPRCQPPDPACSRDFRAVGSQDTHSSLMCFLCSPFSPFAAQATPAFLHDAFEYHAYYIVVLNPFAGTHAVLPPPPKNTISLLDGEDVSVSLQALPAHQFRVFLTPGFQFDYPGDLEIYDIPELGPGGKESPAGAMRMPRLAV
ncbi:hypothetical protein L7F22_033861 [Adiantum nelumboides]|nr:hypothetical protein [Adiantum nelumboides]